MAKIKRIKQEEIIDVTVDYQTKNVCLNINPEFVVSKGHESKIRVLLRKGEATALIKALKSQRDRKGVK